MPFGIVTYNDQGQPICEECGLAFDRVVSHIRQAHNMDGRQYKKKYGLDLKKGICSAQSAEKSRIQNKINFDLVVTQNLIEKGENSRYVKGSSGYKKEYVSEQTRQRLRSQWLRIGKPFKKGGGR